MNNELKIDSRTLAESLYAHSAFHEGEPNPTAKLMKAGSVRILELERELAAAKQTLDSEHDAHMECHKKMEKAEAEKQQALAELASYKVE